MTLSTRLRSVLRMDNNALLASRNEWGARLARLRGEVGCSTLLAQYLDSAALMMPSFKAAGFKVVAHGHGYDVSRRLNSDAWIRRYSTLNDCQAIIAPSSYAKARLVKVGIDEGLIEVIPCGVQVPAEPPVFRPTESPVKIVAVGRLVLKKDLRPVLLALNELRHRRVEFTLQIVGEGPLRAAYEDLIRTNDLDQHVSLLGSLPHTETLRTIELADIFVQHSCTDPRTGEEEGLPVAILEAMARGRAVLATHHAGIPEAIRHDHNGLLIQEHDRQAIVDELERLISDPCLRHRLGGAAFAMARVRFEAKSQLWKLSRLIRHVHSL
jgi:colanic acid/amylovoran biosynthesis glycosyltransferase